MSQTLKTPYPQVNKQHKERFMTCTTKNSQNMQQESCGCGTAAEIAYMGHKSICEEFQWIYERSSYEMLLAVLKKRKKATPHENFPTTTQKDLDCNLLVVMALMRIFQTLTKQMSTWTIQALQLPQLLQQIALAVLAEVAQSQSHSSQSSLPDLIGEQNGGNGGADCLCEEDEEMPPLEDADSTEL